MNDLAVRAIFSMDGGQCPWDLNGNGVVGPEDLAQILGAWGAPYGPAELARLLSVWGPCR